MAVSPGSGLAAKRRNRRHELRHVVGAGGSCILGEPLDLHPTSRGHALEASAPASRFRAR
jgi:hypothetical protein